MKIIAGDWPASTSIATEIDRKTGNLSLRFQIGRSPPELIALANIQSADIVTDDNHMSISRKIGWGVAGAVVLGPVGAVLGGVLGGNVKEVVVAVVFKDGKKTMLKGKKKELEPIIAAGFNWKGQTGAPGDA